MKWSAEGSFLVSLLPRFWLETRLFAQKRLVAGISQVLLTANGKLNGLLSVCANRQKWQWGSTDKFLEWFRMHLPKPLATCRVICHAVSLEIGVSTARHMPVKRILALARPRLAQGVEGSSGRTYWWNESFYAWWGEPSRRASLKYSRFWWV